MQADPGLTALGFNSWLKCDEPLSDCAFKYRHSSYFGGKDHVEMIRASYRMYMYNDITDINIKLRLYCVTEDLRVEAGKMSERAVEGRGFKCSVHEAH